MIEEVAEALAAAAVVTGEAVVASAVAVAAVVAVAVAATEADAVVVAEAVVASAAPSVAVLAPALRWWWSPIPASQASTSSAARTTCFSRGTQRSERASTTKREWQSR